LGNQALTGAELAVVIVIIH